MRHILIILLGSILLLVTSCTEMEQVPESELSLDNFFKTERQVLSAIGPAYAQVWKRYYNAWGLFGLVETVTDEIVFPVRGTHWWDGGVWLRLHWHNYTTTNDKVNYGWRYVFEGVSTCNRVKYQLDQLENPSEATQTLEKELLALRAWFYYWGLDCFGNIPIVDTHDVPENYAPSNSTREEVFNFVVDELKAAIPNLQEEVNSETYGRLTKWGAYTLLAKVYLNAPVYTGDPIGIDGTPMWNECIEACDAVINSGNFSLENDFFANFAIDNQNSSENIFVAPLDLIYTRGATPMIYATLHYSYTKIVDDWKTGRPWNGFCATPTFARTFGEDDIRRDMWAEGLQIAPNGDTLRLMEAVPVAGIPLVHTVEVRDVEVAWENQGLRPIKYDYTGFNGTFQGDLVLFRYADVLLMKAEAIMRKNGVDGEALQLVNQVHTRAGLDPYTMDELTLDTLLVERGNEFATEMWRRNDLIRYGKYIGPFYEDDETKNIQKKVVNQPYLRLFCIPQRQINANPNLEQNPGY